MNSQTFCLQPFSASASLPDLRITGDIARSGNQLIIKYKLIGDWKQVAIAPPSDKPVRKHQLWEDTCFEFFLGVKDAARYWEFNLSPAGHWNVYRFDGYRQGMEEETALRTLPFLFEQQADGLALALDIDLTAIIFAEQAIQVAITAVIKQVNGDVSYWALAHRGAEADFHLRDSFIVEL